MTLMFTKIRDRVLHTRMLDFVPSPRPFSNISFTNLSRISRERIFYAVSFISFCFICRKELKQAWWLIYFWIRGPQHALPWTRIHQYVLSWAMRPKGFPNLRNTCYMNSVLQVFCWTPRLGDQLQKQMLLWKCNNQDNAIVEKKPDGIKSMLGYLRFISWFKQNKDNKERSMTCSLFKLIFEVHGEGVPEVSTVERCFPKAVLRRAREINAQFEGHDQQDSFEMFNTIVSSIEEEQLAVYPFQPKKPDSDTTHKISPETRHLTSVCPVTQLFGGLFITVFNYDSCSHVEEQYQRFTSICVPVPEKRKQTEQENYQFIHQNKEDLPLTTCSSIPQTDYPVSQTNIPMEERLTTVADSSICVDGESVSENDMTAAVDCVLLNPKIEDDPLSDTKLQNWHVENPAEGNSNNMNVSATSDNQRDETTVANEGLAFDASAYEFNSLTPQSSFNEVESFQPKQFHPFDWKKEVPSAERTTDRKPSGEIDEILVQDHNLSADDFNEDELFGSGGTIKTKKSMHVQTKVQISDIDKNRNGGSGMTKLKPKKEEPRVASKQTDEKHKHHKNVTNQKGKSQKKDIMIWNDLTKSVSDHTSSESEGQATDDSKETTKAAKTGLHKESMPGEIFSDDEFSKEEYSKEFLNIFPEQNGDAESRKRSTLVQQTDTLLSPVIANDDKAKFMSSEIKLEEEGTGDSRNINDHTMGELDTTESDSRDKSTYNDKPQFTSFKIEVEEDGTDDSQKNNDHTDTTEFASKTRQQEKYNISLDSQNQDREHFQTKMETAGNEENTSDPFDNETDESKCEIENLLYTIKEEPSLTTEIDPGDVSKEIVIPTTKNDSTADDDDIQDDVYLTTQSVQVQSVDPSYSNVAQFQKVPENLITVDVKNNGNEDTDVTGSENLKVEDEDRNIETKEENDLESQFQISGKPASDKWYIEKGEVEISEKERSDTEETIHDSYHGIESKYDEKPEIRTDTDIEEDSSPVKEERINCLKTMSEPTDFETDLERGLMEVTGIEDFDEQVLGCRICERMGYPAGHKFAHKRLMVRSAPGALVLQINRFRQTFNGKLEKIQGKVTFPLILDVSPFCTSELQRIEGTDKILYYLYGVVAHNGTVESGHYYAYVRTNKLTSSELHHHKFVKPDLPSEQTLENTRKYWTGEKVIPGSSEAKEPNTWYYVSDTTVRQKQQECVLDEANAYILMYERLN